MLILRKLVESSAVNAACVLRLENGVSVMLASIAESVHVFELRQSDAPSTKDPSSSPSASSSPSTSYELCQRGHIFHVGCGVVSLLALANQCFLIWTRDQECIIVRYQANLLSALTDPRVVDGDRVYRPDGEPSPVHFKEHHWYVVHRVRLWCPDACAPLHPPEMGVNDSMEAVHLRICSGHVFLISIHWDVGCLPYGAKAGSADASLRTTRWHTGDYLRMYAGTGFHYPTQSCSAAARRPGESAAAHQRRIEQLWRSNSSYANVPDEDLIASHAVMELSKCKSTQSQSGTSALPLTGRVADRTGVRTVTVRRETYASPSPLMPSPGSYCQAAVGGFTNVRQQAGQAAVHHAGQTLSVSRSTALKDDYAAERTSAFAVASPRRSGRRGLDWTLLAFVTSNTHTAVYHLQRARTPLGAPHYVLDGIFSGSRRVVQVLFCTHSGDASNDVWVVLDSGAVARFAISVLRARNPEALNVQNAHLYPWVVPTITGLPSAFLCRRMLPADDLVGLARVDEAWSRSSNSSAAAFKTGVGHGSLSAYPFTRRYALLSDCVQDVYLVDLVERRVVAALAGDGPMADVCEAPHGYVAAFARGVLRYFQPGMQLHLRGTVRLPPRGVPIHALFATRVSRVAPHQGPSNSVAAGSTSCSAGMDMGVYVMVSTHHTSQLYRVEDANLLACTTKAWSYETSEQTLAFDAVTSGVADIGHGTTVVVVQCTPHRCLLGTVEHPLASPLVHAVVTAVPDVGPVCVGAFSEPALASTHLAVITIDGVCFVDVTAPAGAAFGLPACVTARGLGTAAVEVLVGRWDGCITAFVIQRVTDAASSCTTWRCVASQTIQATFGTASPVQQFLSLPHAGRLTRWMAAHSSGEVSILAIGWRPRPTSAPASSSSSCFVQEQSKRHAEEQVAVSEVMGEMELTFSWAPTSPPYRRAQQKVTCALAPLVRAINPTRNAAEMEGEEEEEVYNGFDGALLQPRDGALLFFSVPLEEGDTQAPPHMQRVRGPDEEDREWVVRLENTVRGIVSPSVAGQGEVAAWRCAVLLETTTAAGTLRYDALVVQHDEVTLCTLDSHLFTTAYPRQHTSSPSLSPSSSMSPTAAVAYAPPRRAYTLACTAPSRYICTRRLQLPQMGPHETLVSIAREPDDEGEGVLLCVTVSEVDSLTRLTTLHSGTQTVLESIVLPYSIAHWMSAVPPNTPRIARAAPLFLMCSENVTEGTVQLQVVAAHPLRIASSETLEESLGWMDVASHGVKVDGAVQVVPTRINSEGDTYGGEVLVTVAVDCAIHLFMLRSYTLLFQHCVMAPACTSSVTLCYPIVSVCTEGDSNVYLQVYPVNDDTEVLAPAYSSESTRPLKQYGKVSWKMRVSMREPSFGACVLAQAPLYDRCVRTDVEGDVTVTFVNLAAAAHSKQRSAAHVKGEDAYVGSAEGPQTFLTHTVRLPAVPVKARVLRHVSPIQRRHPRQLQCSGHNYHLQSSSVRKDLSSRLLLLPCHDGSLYGAFEIPYGFAHPLMRLEQVITDAYALDLSIDMNPAVPDVLHHTYHLQPFHVARALQPLIWTRQAEKQACVMTDAVFEYFLLRDLVSNAYGASPVRSSSASRSAADAGGDVPESNAAIVRRKFTALEDVVQTLLTEEYGGECSVDTCAEMLNIL